MNRLYQNIFSKPSARRWLCVGLLSIFAVASAAAGPGADPQSRTVSGQVIGQDGALSGVMVQQTGTNNVVITDANGSYSIAMSSGSDQLEFSMLGYVSENVTVAGRSEINIIMREDQQMIDNVVVVGYGTQKVTNLTGSVASISGSKLTDRAVPTLTQALQGQVANLNVFSPSGDPGMEQKLNIRGYTGFNATGAPLVVIDGVQGGNLSDVNMNDVESISVLKDAASSAIYGSSAPYGVIIVMTKKGRSGKPTITYSNNFGFSQPSNLPTMTNSVEFAEAFNEAAANSNLPAIYSQEQIQRMRDYQAGLITDETIPNAATDTWWEGHSNHNWYDIYFKNAAFSQQHNVGVSGGSDTSNYYLGLGYNQQGGMLNYANEKNTRYSARVNVSSKITKWLTAGIRTSYARWDVDTPTTYLYLTGVGEYSQAYMHAIGRINPNAALKTPDGGWAEESLVQSLIDGGRSKSTRSNIILTGELQFHFAPGWDATVNYTYDELNNNYTDYDKLFYVARPSGLVEPAKNISPSSFMRRINRNEHHTINAFTTYTKQLGDHYLGATLGFTQELYDNLQVNASNSDVLIDDLPALSMTTGSAISATDAMSQLAIRGAFGRINYNYKEKYLIEVNGRYDGTSRFMKEVRFKFYPGVSAAWVPSKESFWKPISGWFNLLKIRGSWASLGDQSFTTNNYPFYPSMVKWAPSSTYWHFDTGREMAFDKAPIVNYGLTWVTTNTLGFGVDMAFLGNRLNFSFDWYNRHSKDFASAGQDLPAILGTAPPQVNGAEISTKGFEITAGWNDRVGDFSYGITAVLSDYVGKVLKFKNDTKLIASTFYDGMTMGEIWGYETVGLFKDQAEIDSTDQSFIYAQWYPGDVHYRDRNGDGKVNQGANTVDDPGDRMVIGNSTPRYSYGVTLNGAWKNFDLNLFFQGVGKRDVMFHTSATTFWGFGQSSGHAVYFEQHKDRWTPDNPDGYFPRIYFDNNKNIQYQTRYLQSAAYLRLKNLQIGYTLPLTLTGKIGMQRVRVFANVENLFTITPLLKILDPELAFTATASNNLEGKVYPLRKTWSFGINVTF